MMGKLLFAALVLHALVMSIKALPTGAPTSACSTLMPSHSGIAPQHSSPPYSVTTMKEGNKIKIKISSPIGEQFEGFIIQARSSRNRQKIINGRFTSYSNNMAKTVDCSNGRQNTLTHVNKNPKNQINTEWTLNDDVNEEIILRATVLKTYSEFWTEIDSSPFRLENDRSSVSKSQKNDGPRNMFDNCFITKGCFGYPSGCVPRRDCEVLLSYYNSLDGITFELNGYLEQNPTQYMAMALSADPKMGEDAVTECFRQGSSVVARESWNEGRKNTRTRELSVRYSGDFVDGLTRCSWTARYLFEANGRRFNLANSTHYILLAKGPMTDRGALDYHTERIASQEAINLTAFEPVEGEGVSDSVKIHGTFMVTAWVGCVSIAILLARHFKSSWETSTICGVKIWFALHRGLMITGLVFVVVAFIVIFVYKNGWNYETRNPHAILGCIATALGLFQPIMALFRPGADHPKRFIFNWLHFSVGNAAHIIAVITIFFAVSLESSGLKENFYWVIAIFVIVYFLFHFLLQVHTWNSQKKKNNEVKMLEMNSRRGSNPIQNSIQEKNMSENVLRILLLGIYVIFLLAILLALYALIGVA